ncbi:hypothetical protein D7X88_00110 [bacterium C-53]|nr:hypothetical protein [Lachnospiraceae bacterium]NBI01422.1 hypothetical protein [Lachnospiraceae bacterium]RKJ12735.1 hypothetical protein D7X88_00110 [bacterium C-53]
MENHEIDQIIKMLDDFANSDTSRLKIDRSEELKEGEIMRVHHHGRCDIGSPWARGCSFDLIEEDESSD